MSIPLVILLCFVFGCQQGKNVAEEPVVDIEADREAVFVADMAWAKACAAKDVDGIMSFYADDAVRLKNGVPSILYKHDERENWNYWFFYGWESTWKPEKVEVMSSGDYAYSYGTYTNTRIVDEETSTNKGGYLVVWKKQTDGSWKIVALK